MAKKAKSPKTKTPKKSKAVETQTPTIDALPHVTLENLGTTPTIDTPAKKTPKKAAAKTEKPKRVSINPQPVLRDRHECAPRRENGRTRRGDSGPPGTASRRWAYRWSLQRRRPGTVVSARRRTGDRRSEASVAGASGRVSEFYGHPRTVVSLGVGSIIRRHRFSASSPNACGRYVSPDEASIEREFTLVRAEWQFPPSYNVAPTQNVPVVRVRPASAPAPYCIGV